MRRKNATNFKLDYSQTLFHVQICKIFEELSYAILRCSHISMVKGTRKDSDIKSYIGGSG